MNINYLFISGHYGPEKSADLATVFDVGGILGSIAAGAISDVTRGPGTTCAVMLTLAAPAVSLCGNLFLDDFKQNLRDIKQHFFLNVVCNIIIIIMYLYSAQYLHILQDSKRYLTNPTVQV